ncbi:MAG: hypothetical protein L0271_17945 [Gemmatimonadetes bacterium]|nr:hypothetical protein [Gemmatimonadota bacterium]
MSHVDEGLLHAWIDGAFARGDPEGDAIETHIAECAECAVRADEARRLKERATTVLQSVAPDAVRVEPFDRVIAARRRGTDAAHAKRRRRAAMPLAWAASIMLAITAGWMARAYLPGRAGDQAALESEAFAPVQAPAAVADADDEANRAVDAAARDREADPARASNVAESTAPGAAGARRPNEQQGQAAAAGRADALAEVEQREQARTRVIPAAPPPAAVSQAVSQTEALARGARQDSVQARVREEEAAKTVSPDAPAVYRFADATDWRTISVNEASILLGREPLRIDTLRIEALEASQEEGLVRLRQKTAAGIDVDLFQQRGSPLPSDEIVVGGVQSNARALAAGVAERDVLAPGDTPAIALERNGLVLVIRAPLTVDSLRALIARIR